jgi:hypothetical protein
VLCCGAHVDNSTAQHSTAQHSTAACKPTTQDPPNTPLCSLNMLLWLLVHCCILLSRTDGPAWVLRHNATAVHRLSALPPPPPTPPVMADPAAEEERLRLAAVVATKLKQRSYDWFMYDCPAEQLAGRVGRGCRELQEGAISKSATFFANENTLPMEHGTPQVCWCGWQGCRVRCPWCEKKGLECKTVQRCPIDRPCPCTYARHCVC